MIIDKLEVEPLTSLIRFKYVLSCVTPVCNALNAAYETCLKEEKCVICQNSISHEDTVVVLGEKGSQSVNKASKSRQDNVFTSAGQKLHQNCRKSYTNPKYIALANKDIKHETSNVPTLRSKVEFDFKRHCLFCGQLADAVIGRKRKSDVYPVRTSEFQCKIEDICRQREDEWALEVRGRLAFVQDLHAADALYHQTCSVNFRTLKQTPLAFSPPAKRPKTQAGRKSSLSESFLFAAKYLQQNEDEQITVADLVTKMSEHCGIDDAYGVQHMKNKLQEHFGDKLQKGNDIPNFVAESFLQYVADNVDHNSGTLDGNNTFHGMGIMAAVTPGSFGTKPIPRIDVTSEQIALLAKINISYYKPSESNQMASCVYSNLRKMNYKDVDCSYMVNLLWKVSWPLRSPMPGWSGYMQMVQEGTYPGKSSFVFLPMIDLNPSDLSCIYSTLKFICKEAHRYQKPPVVTFDQPLYWKALCIVTNEKTESDIKQMVLRLGGFHTEMSFLGSIGRLMAGSGLHEVLETVYASNAVNHMLSGKAVSRAVRGFMMVENALHILLMKESFRVSLPNAHETDTEADSSECDEIVEKACELYDRFVAGEETTESVEQSSILSEISTKLEATKRNCVNQEHHLCG
ncbi:unnamed protein product [Mytilus edulis]|uniref:Uncharacterized protein n=1 Tax=Mytilus edulis TaxID=6550 RepID=A0A8S3RXR4_MYTED|nr:unnamed protein product [Mytilus edulis]